MRKVRTFFFHTLYSQISTRWFFSPIKLLLYGASYCWNLASHLRNLAYHRKLFKTSKVKAYVVSIGNIIVGGSGKTPFTIFLSGFFPEISCAILTRGYGSKAEKNKNPLVVFQDEHKTVEQIGDEPLLLLKNILKGFLVVGQDRYKAASIAIKKGAKLIILDDGYQYRKLYRDLDIVLVTGEEFLKKQTCLPLGRLRESVQNLSRADLIVINTLKKETIPELKKNVRKFSKAPVIVMKTRLVSLCNWEGKAISIDKKKMALFSSIANPKNFEQLLINEGYEICLTKDALDHEKIKTQELQKFSQTAKNVGASFLVCTEKDRMRYEEPLHLSLPIVFTKTILEVEEGKEEWEKVIEKIRVGIYNLNE